ncbi:MAG: hypothetical protein U0L47_04550 [Paludibacteraceae bacterium]|nr:hypothetical protein [Paludibacteraceae bacterium]
MKKISTLLMATVVALSISALTPYDLGKKDPTGRATELANKELQHHKQVAKTLGLDKFKGKTTPITAPKEKKASAKAQKEVITLNYDAFAFIEYNPDLGDWMLGLSCDDITRPEYGHNLQLNWYAPAGNPCGTFSKEDFIYDLTHLLTPFSYGSIMFSEMSMTLTHEAVNANLERYILEATLVSEDGDTYQVHAKHENIVAKGKVDIYIEDATLTQEGWTFTVEGKNADLDLKLVVDNYDIIGAYGKNMILWESSKIAYKGVTLSPISFKAVVNLASHVETGALAYVTEINMLANDTIDYHFILAAPLPAPTDTIELTAVDLEVDDSNALWVGAIDFYATTTEFSIRGGWRAEYAEEGTYEAAIFLDDVQMNTITSLNAQVTVTLADDNSWAIEGTMLGNDNKIYNLHLSYNVPEQTDTVLVLFANSAQAKYYPHMDNDIQIYNENDLYSASINVSGVGLGEEFDEEYIIAYFSYLEAKDGTPITVAEIKDGKLYQVGDTTKMEADYVTFEGVLYQVRLWYVAPTPTQTVKLDIKDAEMIVDYEYNQAYNLVGYTEDMQTAFVVTVYASSKEDVPGTFVNDGLFGKFGEGQYDFDASNSYIGKWNADKEMYDLYYMEKGQFTVTLDEEDNLTLTASVVCEDAVQYDVTLTSKYEEPHIEFDSEEGPVERIYGADAEVLINDHSADYGLISVQIMDPVAGDITALYFCYMESDPETIIPEGTHEINNTWFDGTVLASTGMDWEGNVMPSYYAGYADGWLVEPFYFFQTGTVEVTKNANGKLNFEINALNSCNIPVHIVYNAATSGVENTPATLDSARKQIRNGQLLIMRDGKTYNALGTPVK